MAASSCWRETNSEPVRRTPPRRSRRCASSTTWISPSPRGVHHPAGVTDRDGPGVRHLRGAARSDRVALASAGPPPATARRPPRVLRPSWRHCPGRPPTTRTSAVAVRHGPAGRRAAGDAPGASSGVRDPERAGQRTETQRRCQLQRFIVTFGGKKPGAGRGGGTARTGVRPTPRINTRPYDRLIGAALDGNRAFFARQDTVETAWRVVDPILDDAVPVHRLPARHVGPRGSRRPASRAAHTWHDPVA